MARCRRQNVPVSGPLVKEKAKVFAAELQISGFSASDGWLTNFKKRNGLIFSKMCGESAAVDVCLSCIGETSVDVTIGTNLWTKLNLGTEVSFHDYVHVDDDVSTAGSLTDAEIVANAVKEDKAACDESSEEEDAQDEWRPSTRDALKAVDTLRTYFQHAEDHGEEVYGGLHAIENALEE